MTNSMAHCSCYSYSDHMPRTYLKMRFFKLCGPYSIPFHASPSPAVASFRVPLRSSSVERRKSSRSLVKKAPRRWSYDSEHMSSINGRFNVRARNLGPFVLLLVLSEVWAYSSCIVCTGYIPDFRSILRAHGLDCRTNDFWKLWARSSVLGHPPLQFRGRLPGWFRGPLQQRLDRYSLDQYDMIWYGMV